MILYYVDIRPRSHSDSGGVKSQIMFSAVCSNENKKLTIFISQNNYFVNKQNSAVPVNISIILKSYTTYTKMHLNSTKNITLVKIKCIKNYVSTKTLN